MGARAVTRPLRAVRARVRGRIARRHHAAEVRAGRSLAERPDRVPIFVLGAPRSGTTLLYQLLVEGLDVGWLTNAHAERASDVVRVEHGAPPRDVRLGSDYDSTHGATRGQWGPSEAGAYWYRFFPRTPHEQHDADSTRERTTSIRAAVRAFADACSAPVVFKNTLNSLRVPVLAAALPEARFVLIERGLADNARSLLVGRTRREGGVDAWWGARPDGADDLAAATPAEQVTWQARVVHDVARAELERTAPARWLHVTYDELCDDPRALVARVHAWLVDGGVVVDARPADRIPARFDRRGGGMLDPALEAQLAAAVAASDRGREDAPR
jgi:hypothetical protein